MDFVVVRVFVCVAAATEAMAFSITKVASLSFDSRGDPKLSFSNLQLLPLGIRHFCSFFALNQSFVI